MTDHKNLAAALVAALADLTVVEKARKANVGTYKYEYASIEDVVKVTRPVLAQHGLVALTPIEPYDNGLACKVTIVHTSGEQMDLGLFPFPHGRDAQATGSLVTYVRRYSLLAALGMAAGDDDDGALATVKEQTARAEESRYISGENVARLRSRCEEHGLDVAEVVSLATDGRTDDPAKVEKSEVAKVRTAVDALAAKSKVADKPALGAVKGVPDDAA